MSLEQNLKENLKILIVSSEMAPFAKSGGLGDVVGSLPKELSREGVDCRVAIPKYRTINNDLIKDLKYIGNANVKFDKRNDIASYSMLDGEFKTYFIDNEYFFGRDRLYGYGDDFLRFAFFCEAVLLLLNDIDFIPDVIHLNDWQTGLISTYLQDRYKRLLPYQNIKTLFTIHNLQYQGIFGGYVLNDIGLNSGYLTTDKLEYHTNISYMKAGLLYSDLISTVSVEYAKEIQTPSFGYGMDGVLRERHKDLVGILNGIDTDINDPKTDKLIYKTFDKDTLINKQYNKQMLQQELNLPVKEVPMLSIVSRLANQKGLDLIANIMEYLMQIDLQLVILGTGEPQYEDMFRYFSNRFPDKISSNICFNNTLAQKIYASSDMFLMPSAFEPCGLSQMYSMRYGTIPIARKTGGLKDTIISYTEDNQNGTGFLFEDYLPSGLMWAINEALNIYRDKSEWQKMMIRAMEKDFSWKSSAKTYIETYKKICE